MGARVNFGESVEKDEIKIRRNSIDWYEKNQQELLKETLRGSRKVTTLRIERIPAPPGKGPWAKEHFAALRKIAISEEKKALVPQLGSIVIR